MGLTQKSEVSLFHSDTYLRDFSYRRFSGYTIYFCVSPNTLATLLAGFFCLLNNRFKIPVLRVFQVSGTPEFISLLVILPDLLKK